MQNRIEADRLDDARGKIERVADAIARVWGYNRPEGGKGGPSPMLRQMFRDAAAAAIKECEK